MRNGSLKGIKIDEKDWDEQVLADIPSARREGEGEGRKKCYYGTPYFLGKYDIGKNPRPRQFEPKN